MVAASLFFILLSLLTFGAGTRYLLRRALGSDCDLIESIAVAMPLLVTCQALCSLAGSAAISLGYGLVVGLQIVGIWRLWKDRRFSMLAPVALGLLAMCALAWAACLEDLDGLPSRIDGIAHSLFFTRLLQQDTAIISQAIYPLTEMFGRAQYGYYPTGIHALWATFSWPLVAPILPWALPAAPLLKAWLILSAAALPVLTLWLARKLDLDWRPWTLALIAIVTFAYQAFPSRLIDSGGVTRLCAYTLGIPLIFRMLSWRGSLAEKALWAVTLPLGGFLMHPGFGLVACFTFAYSCIFELATPARTPAAGFWRSRWKSSALYLVLAATSGVLLLWILKSSHAFEIVQGQSSAAQALTHDQVLNGIWSLFESFLNDGSSLSALRFTPREFLVLLALAAIYQPKSWISPKLRAYPFLLLGFGAFLLTLASSRDLNLRTLANIYYADYARILEAAYYGQILLWLFGARYAQELGTTLAAWTKRSRRKWLWSLVCALGVGYIFDYAHRGYREYCAYIARRGEDYASPRHSRSDDLVAFISEHVPPDALLVSDLWELDSMEFRTRRRTLFVYHECGYNTLDRTPCQERVRLYQALKELIQRRLEAPTPEQRCAPKPAASGPSLYIFLKQTEAAAEPTKKALCQDLEMISKVNDYSVFRLLPAPRNG